MIIAIDTETGGVDPARSEIINPKSIEAVYAVIFYTVASFGLAGLFFFAQAFLLKAGR